MSDNETETIESFVTLADRIEVNQNTADLPSVHVLEAIQRGTQLRDSPVAVLCPGCADSVDYYEDGLPAYVAHFRACCSECDIPELERWSVLAVDASHAGDFSADALARHLHEYWESNLWTGVEPSEAVYRSEEFTSRYDDRAAAFGWDWRARCPLCRRPATELDEPRLDYHHWRHDPDIGVSLCRTCHQAIDAGHRDGNLGDYARELGFANRYDLLIARLAAREAIVAHYESLDTLVETLKSRYNLPWDASTIRCTIRQALDNEAVRRAIDDDLLREGIDG